MKHRNLTDYEICTLEQQACRCDDWSEVQVIDGFNPKYVRNCNFSGNVKIGLFDAEVTFLGGIKKHTGICNATIHNCIIGNNVYIGQIRNYVANYIIENNVVIENVDLLAVENKSSFGNGVIVSVLNENGGRDVPIYDNLSSHLAYIIALYRHRPNVIDKITKMIEDYSESVSSEMGIIKQQARITNCRTLINIKIGAYSVLDGIYRLINGTINSNKSAPTHIGSGVIAENFIISSGSEISGASVVHNCFIGQGCLLSKQYSAEHSLFFANCQGLHGEACAIFAGPYTVTHHKSTLLISGYYSFLNAGSGSNQSNHMYKLGPIHQGVVERGSKTTSDSYVLWPARIGPFSLVMGRHYKHSDTSDLPFSYIIEHGDDSMLVPGVNLRSVGTVRDAQKWPKRDKRTDSVKLDYINFNLLSPFTIHRMMKGKEILQTLRKISGETSDFYSYQSAKIKPSSLKGGLRMYETGINKFLGNSLIKRLESIEFRTNAEIQNKLKPDTEIGTGEWLDIGGLIAPKSEVKKLMSGIESGAINSLEQIANSFQVMHDNYYTYEWTWAIEKIESHFGISIEKFTAQDVINIVEIWKDCVIGLDQLLYDDAKKEFALSSKIGFGIDGEEDVRNLDFEQVRGEFEQNTFVEEIITHMEKKSNLGNELIERMGRTIKRIQVG